MDSGCRNCVGLKERLIGIDLNDGTCQEKNRVLKTVLIGKPFNWDRGFREGQPHGNSYLDWIRAVSLDRNSDRMVERTISGEIGISSWRVMGDTIKIAYLCNIHVVLAFMAVGMFFVS